MDVACYQSSWIAHPASHCCVKRVCIPQLEGFRLISAAMRPVFGLISHVWALDVVSLMYARCSKGSPFAQIHIGLLVHACTQTRRPVAPPKPMYTPVKRSAEISSRSTNLDTRKLNKAITREYNKDYKC